jgi:hypothetical protein
VTALGVLTLLAGTVAFRAVQPHIDDARAARRGYAAAGSVAALGAVGLAAAPRRPAAARPCSWRPVRCR